MAFFTARLLPPGARTGALSVARPRPGHRGPGPGLLISTTALGDPDYPESHTEHWIDSERVPVRRASGFQCSILVELGINDDRVLIVAKSLPLR